MIECGLRRSNPIVVAVVKCFSACSRLPRAAVERAEAEVAMGGEGYRP